jgi:hypothetical protein
MRRVFSVCALAFDAVQPERYLGGMSYRGLFLIALLVVACGGEAQKDAPAMNSKDAGALACGAATCTASQICLYPQQCKGAEPDGGVCPPGTAILDANGICFANTPSCVTPAADQGSYECSEGVTDPTFGCGEANFPIPAACSRTCHTICL